MLTSLFFSSRQNLARVLKIVNLTLDLYLRHIPHSGGRVYSGIVSETLSIIGNTILLADLLVRIPFQYITSCLDPHFCMIGLSSTNVRGCSFLNGQEENFFMRHFVENLKVVILMDCLWIASRNQRLRPFFQGDDTGTILADVRRLAKFADGLDKKFDYLIRRGKNKQQSLANKKSRNHGEDKPLNSLKMIETLAHEKFGTPPLKSSIKEESVERNSFENSRKTSKIWTPRQTKLTLGRIQFSKSKIGGMTPTDCDVHSG